MDIVLPDSNGFELMQSLFKVHHGSRRARVIIISGLTSEDDEEKGFLLGAVDYIKKPFKNAIVKARIATQIQIINQMRAIEQLSLTDELTNVLNRRAFDKKLKYEWARAARENNVISLLMIDIDKFKEYNDTYGHLQGDIMLRSVADTIKSMLKRSTDIVCRYGGEEFAVILPGTDSRGAVEMAERIRNAIAELRISSLYSDKLTKVTISVGVATLTPTCKGNVESAIENADRMLYEAKKAGRNCVHFKENVLTNGMTVSI